jgi:probable HAF family extracellular repeat protein
VGRSGFAFLLRLFFLVPFEERIMFRRWISVFGVVCLSCCLGAADSWGAGQYRLTDLGAFPSGRYSGSLATAINKQGVVVGCSDDSNGRGQPARFANGTITNLNTIGAYNGSAKGINASGQVVGTIGVGDNLHAFLYSGGMVDLSVYLGSQCQANAINSSGQVVGVASNSKAYVYNAGSKATVNLGCLPGDEHSQAYGINDNGQVVGISFAYTPGIRSVYHPFLYSNGTMTSVLPTGQYGWASGINNQGQVVGWTAPNIDAPTRAFLCSSGTTTDLGVLTGWNASRAEGINDSGQVVGNCYGDQGAMCAFVYSDGAMQRLDSLVTSLSGWQLLTATAINSSGQIVGQMYNGTVGHAYLLTPVPEPSTFALLAIGAVGLLAYAWRRRKCN